MIVWASGSPAAAVALLPAASDRCRRRSCSRSRTAPTGAACARSGASRRRARALPRRRRAQRRPRSGAASPTGASTPRSSSMPTPSATSRPGRPGARRSARPTFVARGLDVRRTPPRSTPTSSSRPSPTPRRRAPSPTPTAASSACAPAIPHPGHVRPMWQVLVELSALLGDETGIDSAPEALDAIASEVPFYAGITHEEIGGTRRALAGARGGRRDFPQPRVPRRSPARRPSRVCRHRCRLNLRRPARGGRRCDPTGHLPRPVGGGGRRTTARRCGSLPRRRPSSWRPRTPTASASAAATRSTCAQTARACGPGSRSASGSSPAPAFLIEGLGDGNANALVPGEIGRDRRRPEATA